MWLLEAKSFDLAIVKTREDILKISKNGREKSLRMGGGVLRKFSPLLPEPIAMCQAYSARLSSPIGVIKCVEVQVFFFWNPRETELENICNCLK